MHSLSSGNRVATPVIELQPFSPPRPTQNLTQDLSSVDAISDMEVIERRTPSPLGVIANADEEAGSDALPRPIQRTFSQIARANLYDEVDRIMRYREKQWQAIIDSGARWKERGIGAVTSAYRVVIDRGTRLKRAATKRAIEGKYAEKCVHFSTLFSSFAVIATSKMAEEEKDEGGTARGVWEVTFMLLYILWGFSVTISLYFDWLQAHSKVFNTVSHIGCTAIVLYFFASILSIKTPTTVLPISINLGLLASLGVQRISPEVKDRIFTWIGTCLGMPYQPGRDDEVEDSDV